MAAPEKKPAQEWVSPAIRCKFGPYFRADADEQLKEVQMVQAALGAGKPPGVKLITVRQGLEKIAPLFGIENIDAALESLEEEQQKAADDQHQKELELQSALAKQMKDGEDDSGDGASEGGAKD